MKINMKQELLMQHTFCYAHMFQIKFPEKNYC